MSTAVQPSVPTFSKFAESVLSLENVFTFFFNFITAILKKLR